MARPSVNRPLQWIALLAFAAIAVWLGWRLYERQWLNEPIPALQAPVSFEVRQGASLRAVAQALESKGLMERPGTWLRYGKSEGLATRIQAGEYRLSPGTTPAMLLAQFVAGDVVLHSLTLPEGWTIRQGLAAIQSHAEIKSELRGLSDTELLARLGLSGQESRRTFLS